MLFFPTPIKDFPCQLHKRNVRKRWQDSDWKPWNSKPRQIPLCHCVLSDSNAPYIWTKNAVAFGHDPTDKFCYNIGLLLCLYDKWVHVSAMHRTRYFYVCSMKWAGSECFHKTYGMFYHNSCTSLCNVVQSCIIMGSMNSAGRKGLMKLSEPEGKKSLMKLRI